MNCPLPTTPAAPSLLEAAEAMASWLHHTRDAFQAGHTVHLTICPGDGTRYAVTFVAPTPIAVWTRSPWGDPAMAPDQALLVFHNANRSVVITPSGYPVDSFVAEKLGTDNSYTVLAVGLAWFLMVGNTPEQAVAAFQAVTTRERHPNPLDSWDLGNFEVVLSTGEARP